MDALGGDAVGPLPEMVMSAADRLGRHGTV